MFSRSDVGALVALIALGEYLLNSLFLTPRGKQRESWRKP